MLTDRVKEHIQGLGDQQLAEYLAAGEQLYEPAAVDFAAEEFARRNLDTETADKLIAAAAASIETETAANEAIANEPLDRDGRALAFVSGILCPVMVHHTLGAWAKMKVRKEHRKAQETMRFFLFGLALDIAALAITALAQLWRQHP
ncbi:MAG TPA: hypothetical protein VHY37_07240 [Tepidisphaeraceae bacterium]|jgi:hypothetical protein|nr:hypothetical protein [Tepidisphaeraceae bacterium]